MNTGISNPWFENAGRDGGEDQKIENVQDEKFSDPESNIYALEKSTSFVPEDLNEKHEVKDISDEEIPQPVRGVTFQDFVDSVKDFHNNSNPQLARISFSLWKEEKWNDLEDLFVKNNLNQWEENSYPPNNGGINNIYKTLDPKDFDNNLIIDRYGSTNGSFISLFGTPFSARALPEKLENVKPNVYKIIEPIEDVVEGAIIPWFGQKGLGKQFKLPKPLKEYLREGSIIEID